MRKLVSQQSLSVKLKNKEQLQKEAYDGFAYDHGLHLGSKKVQLGENFNFYREEI